MGAGKDMIRTEIIQIPSSDGVSTLYGRMWVPEQKPVAVLQLVHGMKEYVERYDSFARWMAKRGVLVAGHDQLGHGRTAQNGRRGRFADRNGAAFLIKDIHRVTIAMRERFQDLPYFMMGHSMGSFLLRRYITLAGTGLSGIILMGTGGHSLPVIAAANAVAGSIGLAKGREYQSPLLYKLVTGKFNECFRPVRTPHDWLSRNQERVSMFNRDPFCDFYFSCGAYEDFFQVLMDLNLHRDFRRIPRKLPILLVSGAKDPVGWFGKGVSRVYRTFCSLGLSNVEMRLYPGMRHELLGEIGREAVYEDLASWIGRHGVKLG